MNISDKAIEAATQALRNAFDNGVDGFRDQARAALEDAAPHLMAAAWDEGHQSGFWNGRLSQLTVPYGAPKPEIGVEHAKSHNPYRVGASE